MSLITNIVCKPVCTSTRYLTLERVETTVKERGYFWAANRIREGCSRWRGRFPLLFFPIDVVAAVNFLSSAAEGVTRLEVTLWPMGGPRFVNSIGFLWIFVLGIKKLLMNWGVYSSHGTRTLKRGRRVRGKSECAASAGYRDFEGWCKYSSKQERKIEGREEKRREGWRDPRHSSVSPSLKRILVHQRKDERCSLWNMLSVRGRCFSR